MRWNDPTRGLLKLVLVCWSLVAGCATLAPGPSSQMQSRYEPLPSPQYQSHMAARVPQRYVRQYPPTGPAPARRQAGRSFYYAPKQQTTPPADKPRQPAETSKQLAAKPPKDENLVPEITEENIALDLTPAESPREANFPPTLPAENYVPQVPKQQQAEEAVAAVPEIAGPQIVSPHDSSEQQGEQSLTLNVAAPKRAQVGSMVTYELTVENHADESATGVIVECEFDSPLSFPGSTEQKVRQSLGRIASNDRKQIRLTLVCDEAGRPAARFRVKSDDHPVIRKEVGVEFVKRQYELELIGPSERTVGGHAEYTLSLINKGGTVLREVEVRIDHESVLTPKEATAGVQQENGRLTWKLDPLSPGEGVQLQVEFACPVVAEQTCIEAHIDGRNIPQEDLLRCLQVQPLVGELMVQLDDDRDPVTAGQEIDYRVRIENLGLSAVHDVSAEISVTKHLDLTTATTWINGKTYPAQVVVGPRQLTVAGIKSLEPGVVAEIQIRAKTLQAGTAQATARIQHAKSRSNAVVREPTLVNPAR